jgi:hypothetical protein
MIKNDFWYVVYVILLYLYRLGETCLAQVQKRQLNRPRGIILHATVTFCIGLIQFGEGLYGILENSEGVQYFIQRIWLIGIGISEMIVAISTFRGKGWGWNSNVVSQLAIIVLLTISLIQFFGDPSGLNEYVVIVAPLPIILNSDRY